MSRMERLADKSVVLLACIGTIVASGAVDAAHVTALLLAVGASALFELVAGRFGSHAAFAPLYGAVCAAAFGTTAAGTVMLPLAAYDLARLKIGNSLFRHVLLLAWLAPLSAWAAFGGSFLLPCAIGVCCLGASLLSLRTGRALAAEHDRRFLDDSLRSRLIELGSKNQELLDAHEYEAREAALSERTRIARDIHDRVGHELTRLSLQTKAMQVLHADEPGLADDFAAVAQGIDAALDSMRKSVHALADDGLDLSVELDRLAERSAIQEVRVACLLDDEPPAAVSRCLIAAARECLTNAARHAQASRAQLRVTEYPAFWRLIVRNDGIMPSSLESEGAFMHEGMGLRTMREQAAALGGSMRLSVGEDFTVLVIIPKPGNEGEGS